MEPVVIAKLVDAPHGSPAWHDVRRAGIGSSDAAAIANLDPFNSPFSKWAEKTADSWPSADNAALTWGTRLEAAVADHFADQHPEFVVEPPTAMYAHPDRLWMRASPDRLLHQDFNEPMVTEYSLRGILEIKTSRLDHAWEEGPPDYVTVQVQHQLAVMALDWAYVAVLLHGRDYREFYVERDETQIGYLYQIEEAFWRRVLDCNPPPVDGTVATVNALRALYVPETDLECVLPDGTDALLHQVRRARRQVKDLETERARLENRVKQLLGNATVGVLDGRVVVTWKAGKRRRLDVEALRAAHPALADEFTNETDTRTLTIP